MDYESLPLEKVAFLVCGLREDSRIMLKATDRFVSVDRLIQAQICDNLSMLVWAQTKDGQKGRNRPKRFVDVLINHKKDTDVKKFDSSEDFLNAWNGE